MPGIGFHILSPIVTKSCKGWSMSPTLQVRKPRLQKATGCRQDVNPRLLIPKPRGRCVLLPLWLFLRVHRSHCCTCGPCPLSRSSWHTHEGQEPRQTNAQQRPASRHSCPTTYAPEALRAQAALRTERVLSVIKRGHNQHADSLLSGSKGGHRAPGNLPA